jgi:nuclear RNA export factor
VRKRFPKVLKLDGVDLSPPILFDVNEDFRMPASKGHYVRTEDAKSMARQFLEQYFQLYDSDNREQLVSAYHSEAMFSMTSTYPPGQSSTTTPKLMNYISDSRNLLRVKDSVRRQKLLYQGKMAVVTGLSKLPKTQHDPHSFTVDVTLFTPQVIMMSISGLFLEQGPRTNQPLRSFNRVFVIVPFGAGFCIINEQLFVTNATEEQSKVAFKTSAPIAVSPPAPLPVAASPPVTLVDESAKQQLMETFAAQSGMNVAWARKCLDETGWDIQQAMYVFTELNKQGTIPAEAFIK